MKTILVPLDRYNSLVKRATGTDETESLSSELILLSIPKTFRGKAEALLAHLRDTLKWNARGELVISGKVVLNSNVTDLIKDLYRREYAGPPPYAADVFWTLLKEANVPLSLILNDHRKEHLQTLSLEPPPEIELVKQPSPKPRNPPALRFGARKAQSSRSMAKWTPY